MTEHEKHQPAAPLEEENYPVSRPGIEPSPEAKAAAEPEKQALQDALRQIKSPQHARAAIDAALAAAEGKTERDIREEEGSTSQDMQRVQRAVASLGREKTAEILLEASRQVASSSGEAREALEQAYQQAANPEQQGNVDPELKSSLDILRAELLKRLRPWQAVDARLFLTINHLPHPRIINRLMYLLTVIMTGGGGWIVGLIGAALLDHRRGRAALHRIVPPLWFATMTVEYPIKYYFRRRRPFVDIVQAISVGRKPGSYSFPSGHSAAAFAGAWLLSRHYPKQAAIWYTIASTVAFSRIYLGAHYPGDVISGSLAGLTIAEGIRWVIDRGEDMEIEPPSKA